MLNTRHVPVMGQPVSWNEFEQGVNQQDDGYDQREQYTVHVGPMIALNSLSSDDGFRNGVIRSEVGGVNS